MRRRWQYVPEGVIEDPRMTKLKRLLLVGLAVVGMVMGLAPETANAVWQSSGWQCVDNGNCKYGQGKIRWDTAPSPDSIEVSWFGSTSRSCAGGPGQGSWRLVQAKTFNDATGVAVTATGTKPWRSNGECVTSPGPPYAWYQSFSVNKPSNASQHWWFKHSIAWWVCDTPPAGVPQTCDWEWTTFYPYLRIDF